MNFVTFAAAFHLCSRQHSKTFGKMPDNGNTGFYKFLDSVSQTQNAVQQNKEIKEAQFAEDAREPNEQEIQAIHRELESEREIGKPCQTHC